jgi:hypothetical protein
MTVDFRSIADAPKSELGQDIQVESEAPRSPANFLFVVILAVVTALGLVKLVWG